MFVKRFDGSSFSLLKISNIRLAFQFIPSSTRNHSTIQESVQVKNFLIYAIKIASIFFIDKFLHPPSDSSKCCAIIVFCSVVYTRSWYLLNNI